MLTSNLDVSFAGFDASDDECQYILEALIGNSAQGC